MLVDNWGREVDYLRISVTQRCNYDCIYCHREGEQHILNEELSKEKILLIAKVAKDLGFKKVKLTGGEPLLRRDIVEIVEGLSDLGFEDISIVTNGYLLDIYAKELSDAGLHRVNVSIPSLRKEKYRLITRVRYSDVPERIINSLKIAKGLFKEVKVNVVVMREINEDEIFDFINLSAEIGVIVQFIELQAPQGYDMRFFWKHYLPLKNLENKLESEAIRVDVSEYNLKKRLYLSNGAIVEVVRPMFNPLFCKYCRKLRVTSDGSFKPCLLRTDNHVKINDWSENGIKEALLKAISLREPYFKERGVVIAEQKSFNG